MSSLSDIPEIASAAALERERRQEAWLELEEPLLGKIYVKPLTLRHCLYLDLAGNWYVVGSPVVFDGATEDYLKTQAYQQAQYLWVISEDFQPGADRARNRFFKCLRKLDMVAMDRAIREFHESAFFDAPSGGGAQNHDCPLVDWVSAIVHEFAANYGWGYDKTLDTPLRILLQLRRCIRMAADPKAKNDHGNPLSDAAKKAWLDEQNAKKRQERSAREA